MAVKIGDLAKAVMKELDDYGVAVGLEVEKVSKEVAEDTAKMLNKTSPKLTGDYAASWTYGTGETKRTKHTMVVHAEKPEYALTHLLEKGHQKRSGGRTKAIVHIALAEEAAVDELEKELRTRLYIDFNGAYNNTNEHTLRIMGNTCVDIKGKLCTATSWNAGTVYTTYTGTRRKITNIRDIGNGAIEWSWTDETYRNGLLMG